MRILIILNTMNPEKIGRYVIKELLGRGGMATVYLAYDELFEREVAIKLLPREMLHDPQFRVRFDREAKTIAMLEHSAIVPVYDFGEDDGQPFFVMRYMSGGSLSDRIKKGPISLQESAKMMERLSHALDDAHSKGIIHRDLKPGNILFDKRGDAYVSDFGIAKLSDSGSTVTGNTIIGTPAYMSPEQAQGETIDSRADIYALGIILYEMLSGKQPFEADTPMGVVLKQITEPIKPIQGFNPNLPVSIEKVIEIALSKKRENRYAKATDLSSALTAVALKEDPEMPPPTQVQSQPVDMGNATLVQNIPAVVPKKNKKKTWIAVGIIGFLVIAGLGAILFTNLVLPMLANSDSTAQVTSAATQDTVGISPTDSNIPGGGIQSPATSEPQPPVVEVTSTPAGIPVIGGADQVAFIANKDIWIMNVDGSNLQQITTDQASKEDLQWLPSGNELIYTSGLCVRTLNITTGEMKIVTCFRSAQELNAFEVSPDGSQVAITLDHVLYVMPFDLDVFSKVQDHPDLIAIKSCLNFYNAIPMNDVHWSKDGLKIAIGFWGVDAGRRVDMIRVVDISSCNPDTLIRLDEFPGSFFVMDYYDKNPIIPSFSWDGESLFVLNSIYFNGTFGPLYKYNMNLHKAEKINPVEDSCCYQDAKWSPDGSYIIFAYSDLRKGGESQTELYYIPFGTVGTGETYTPLPLPAGFFKDVRESPKPVLRPAN